MAKQTVTFRQVSQSKNRWMDAASHYGVDSMEARKASQRYQQTLSEWRSTDGR